MANSELNALTAATAATGGIYYGEQSGASRKFTATAAGATLMEAANAAAQRTALGLATSDSPQFTALNIGAATDTTLTRVSAGVIAVEGSTILVSGGALGTPSGGTLTNCTGLPVSTGISGLGTGVATALAAGASTGGNGATDSGKVATFNSVGGLTLGGTSAVAGAALIVNATSISCLQLGAYGANMFGMDVTSHANTCQAYVFHASGTGQVGVVLDMTASAGTSTGFGADFSGAGAASNTGIQLVMDGAGKAIDTDAFDVMASGATTWTPTANTTALTVASATHTSSAPILDAAQTWNAGGTTFTAVKLNVTNTASAAGSLLMDLQVGGTSAFKVDKTGAVTVASTTASTSDTTGAMVIAGGLGVAGKFFGGNDMGLVSTWGIVASNGNQTMYTTGAFGWPSSGGGVAATQDLSLVRKAAATLQMGLDAAGVTDQMFTAANRITSDGVGANLTIAAGNGRGGAGGSLILSTFTTASPGVAGSLTSRMTIDTSGVFTFCDAANFAFNTTTGTKIGTATGQKIGFWNAPPVVQQVLATGGGATVDNVITFLQTIGLCKQS